MRHCLLFVLLLVLGLGPAWAGNTHTLPSGAQEYQAYVGEALSGSVVEDCLHGLSGTTSATILRCRLYAQVPNPTRLVYAQDLTARVVTYSAGDGTYWVIGHRDTTTGLSGWTRVQASHYLWQQGSSQPALPAGAAWLMAVTVSGGAITAATDLRDRRLVQSETVSTSRTARGVWRWEVPGSLVTVAAAETLTLEQCPQAGRWQIFNADALTTGRVRLLTSACTEIFPEWWGGPAIADGVTSASAAVQLAVDSVVTGAPATSTIGVVALRNGDYHLTTTVQLPNVQLTLQGESWSTRVFGSVDPLIAYPVVAPSHDGPTQTIRRLFLETTANNTGIRVHQIWVPLVKVGPTIDTISCRHSAASPSTPICISLQGLTTGKILNSAFNGISYTHPPDPASGGYGIFLDVADTDITTSVMNVLISGNHCWSVIACVYAPNRTFLDPDPGRIEGVQISNNMMALGFYGVRMYRGLATTVINNNISDYQHGVEFYGEMNPVIVGNAITGCKASQIHMEAIAEYPSQGIVITGNSLSPNHLPVGVYGILLKNDTVDEYLRDIVITGNTITGVLGTNVSYGVALAGTKRTQGLIMAGNVLSWHATGLFLLPTTPGTQVVIGENSYFSNTVNIQNPELSGTVVNKTFGFAYDATLTGGATAEVVNIPIPANVFSAKPASCTIMGADPVTYEILGWYAWADASSTATNVVARLARNAEGTNLDPGTVSLVVTCVGVGYVVP